MEIIATCSLAAEEESNTQHLIALANRYFVPFLLELIAAAIVCPVLMIRKQ